MSLFECRMEIHSGYIKLQRSAVGRPIVLHRARFSSQEQLLSQLLKSCILLTTLGSMVSAPTNYLLSIYLMASVQNRVSEFCPSRLLYHLLLLNSTSPKESYSLVHYQAQKSLLGQAHAQTQYLQRKILTFPS